MSLKEKLSNWTDVDFAQHALSIALGIIPDETLFPDKKYIYWTANLFGATLYSMLNELVAIGILERREDPDIQFRWKIQVEEGGPCPMGCGGKIVLPLPKNCSCHISPPCSQCENLKLTCDHCGWEMWEVGDSK